MMIRYKINENFLSWKNNAVAVKCIIASSIIGLLINFLVGCTGSRLETSDKNEQINPQLAIKTFSMGFQQISEKYIDETSTEKLALHGLLGLKLIDSTFQVSQNSKKIIIQSDALGTHQYRPPSNEDYFGWASLIVKLIVKSKNTSIVYSETEMSKFYKIIFDKSLSLLDPFSKYANEKKARKNREKRSGFGGIGIRYDRHIRGIIVTQVFPDTPASKAGIRKRDIITHINQRPAIQILFQNINKHLRGKINTSLQLKVLNEIIDKDNTKHNYFRNLVLKRDRITLPTSSYTISKDILYIRLFGFNGRTSSTLAMNIIRGMKKFKSSKIGGIKGIIIDLRNNRGGLLKQAVKVANLFMKKGKILSTRGRHPLSNKNYKASGTDITRGLPIIVIMNGATASASEILAAALQNNSRAIIIGSTSYGKGTVQTIIRLPNNGEIALTWSRLKAPSGYYIENLGVTPSICSKSGKKKTAIASIRSAIEELKKYKSDLQGWRTTNTEYQSKIKKPKFICPASKQKNSLDRRIAEKLLLDINLYNKVMKLNMLIAKSG